jgi:hypothetical protein
MNPSISAEDSSPEKISYLDANVSKSIDDKLTTASGFTFDQLMELAGLSVAMAVKDYSESLSIQNKKILVICGPVNNGCCCSSSLSLWFPTNNCLSKRWESSDLFQFDN